MEKNKKEQLVLVVLVLALLVFLPKVVFKKRPQATEGNTAPEMAVPDIQHQQAPMTSAVAGPAPAESESAALKTSDPFDVPDQLQKKLILEEEGLVEVTEEDVPDVRISGIVWGGVMPVVFIDDKVYRIGDVVSDAKILAIEKRGVYFLYHDKKVLVRLKKEKQAKD